MIQIMIVNKTAQVLGEDQQNLMIVKYVAVIIQVVQIVMDSLMD